MTPAQFLARIPKGAIPPAVLLLGQESYGRRRIKEAMLAAAPESALAQHDLTEVGLADVLDDARALSLFASERLIWVLDAETALPRVRSDDEDGDAPAGDPSPLAAYMKDPTPGVTIVFEAARFDFEGDDKRKQDRVRKFYAAIPDVVELKRYSAGEARFETEAIAKRLGLKLDPSALELLVEALGADMARIAIEVEKLSLYATGRTLSADDIAALAPEARAATIFALVNALGRRDRTRSLEILDTLTREGEYLPLALAFLSTQFRMALVAREAALKSPQMIQAHFSRIGVPIWGSRAEQVYQTAVKFNGPQLRNAMQWIFEADRGLRDARPDDRIVMEQFVLKLTA